MDLIVWLVNHRFVRVLRVLKSQLVLASSVVAVKENIVALCSREVIKSNHFLCDYSVVLYERPALGHY